jgi:hypothetical protein
MLLVQFLLMQGREKRRYTLFLFSKESFHIILHWLSRSSNNLKIQGLFLVDSFSNEGGFKKEEAMSVVGILSPFVLLVIGSLDLFYVQISYFVQACATGYQWMFNMDMPHGYLVRGRVTGTAQTQDDANGSALKDSSKNLEKDLRNKFHRVCMTNRKDLGNKLYRDRSLCRDCSLYRDCSVCRDRSLCKDPSYNI